jgi:hypothetical protein
VCGLTHQKDRCRRYHFAELDVAVEDTCVCLRMTAAGFVQEVEVDGLRRS